jgi:hypothetical protein
MYEEAFRGGIGVSVCREKVWDFQG